MCIQWNKSSGIKLLIQQYSSIPSAERRNHDDITAYNFSNIYNFSDMYQKW